MFTRRTTRGLYGLKNRRHEKILTIVRRCQTSTEKSKRLRTSRNALAAATLTILIGGSLYLRLWRQQLLEELEYVTSASDFSQRNVEELIVTIERTGLMGITGARSVKAELDGIRKWHLERGYKGGLVLRELAQPLFTDQDSGVEEKNDDLTMDPSPLERRECYYLYYEITGNGEIRQQIFCRGTTLAVDILTCLSFWVVHDEELGCELHSGFLSQADRILEDIQPLLAPANDKRTTIEVSGHSLGGAVAFIVAAKLRKRGYNVVRVTSIAAPRFTNNKYASVFESLLPSDNLRIMNDTDPVPLLPPFGCHTGKKFLYLMEHSGAVAYSTTNQKSSWIDQKLFDSFFLNFLVPEILSSRGKPHRVPNHINHIKSAIQNTEN